jgi:conjugative relaxase-like TrwC/TraI family protein
MLSIGKVGGKDADPRYYTRSVASGREDYYAGGGEAQGEWTGQGAQQRTLVVLVEEDDFIAALTPPAGSERTLLAFDLTFSAPKSVSVLWAVAGPEVAQLVREAHDAAVEQALAYVEREATWTRRGRAGYRLVAGDGLTIAKFRHRSSRAGDPQLHTHSVVVNETLAEGRGTTLDGRSLYAYGTTAGYLYQAALRAELTRMVGVQWEPVEGGIAEISGIDEHVRRVFSQRRQEVLAQMAKVGGRSTRSAQIAALETRRAKDYDVSPAQLHDDWRVQAAEAGLGQARLAEVLGRARPREPAAVDLEVVGADLTSPKGITMRFSTFDRRDAIRAWAAAHREGVDVRAVEAISDHWMASADTVQLDDGHDRRHLGGARYTTPEMLEVERRLIETATERKAQDIAVVREAGVRQVLDDRPSLTAEQRALVEQTTQSGDGVQVILAAAGTGKTYALSAARDAWEHSGIPVFGCALAARAAIELETSAGIDATTIARLTNDIAHGYGLPPRSVLVVDEAGMVGSRALLELAEHAAVTDSKLLLVGDDRQLPELNAGGGFRELARTLGAVELRQIRRQRHAWDREALTHLRAGRVDEWATAYEAHGRITAKPTITETRNTLVDDWWQAVRRGDEDVVMIAHRRADVADLNVLARERMQAERRLSEEQLVTARGRPFAIGDRVLARRNDRRLGVVNGTRGEVVALDAERDTLTVRVAPDLEVVLDRPYLDDEHLDHGYALTAHAAQGLTVDRSFILGTDDLYREWGYTALSRHREEARFYIVSPGSTERALPGLEVDSDVADELRRPFHASRMQRTAHERASETVAVVRADAARALQRAEELEAEHAATAVWKRRDRAELVERADGHRAAADRWLARAEVLQTAVPPAPTHDVAEPDLADAIRQVVANKRPKDRMSSPLHDRAAFCERATALVGPSPELAALPSAGLSPADVLPW